MWRLRISSQNGSSCIKNIKNRDNCLYSPPLWAHQLQHSLHSCIGDRYCIFMSNCAQSRADDKKNPVGRAGSGEEQKLIDKRGERERRRSCLLRPKMPFSTIPPRGRPSHSPSASELIYFAHMTREGERVQGQVVT